VNDGPKHVRRDGHPDVQFPVTSKRPHHLHNPVTATASFTDWGMTITMAWTVSFNGGKIATSRLQEYFHAKEGPVSNHPR